MWNRHWFDCVSVYSRTLTVHFVLVRKLSPNQDLIGVFAPIAQASSYDTSNSYASYNQSAGFKDYQPQQQPPPQHQHAAAAAPAQPRYNAANMAPSQQPQPPAAGPHSTYNAGYGNASSAYGGTASPAPSTSAPLSGAGNQVSRLFKHISVLHISSGMPWDIFIGLDCRQETGLQAVSWHCMREEFRVTMNSHDTLLPGLYRGHLGALRLHSSSKCPMVPTWATVTSQITTTTMARAALMVLASSSLLPATLAMGWALSAHLQNRVPFREAGRCSIRCTAGNARRGCRLHQN